MWGGMGRGVEMGKKRKKRQRQTADCAVILLDKIISANKSEPII